MKGKRREVREKRRNEGMQDREQGRTRGSGNEEPSISGKKSTNPGHPGQFN